MSKKWRNAAALVQHANSDDVLTRTLIKQGAWQKELGPLDKTAALMHSAQHGLEVCVKLLIVANADVHARDRLGRTPLMLASTNAKETNVQLLLAARADSDTTDKKGWTCIMHACREDRQLNVQLLLMDGADPAAGSEDGWTPLSVASHYGRKDCTKYLLAAGADRKKTNEKHETAWDLAKKQGHSDILKVLEAPPPKLAVAGRHESFGTLAKRGRESKLSRAKNAAVKRMSSFSPGARKADPAALLGPMPETQEYAPRDLAALGGPLTVVVHGEPTWQPRTDDDSASEAHSVDPSEMAPSELSFAPPSESVDVSELLVGVTRGPL